VVNALSAWLEVRFRREGALWFQRYERGVPTSDVEQIGQADENGTEISFKPDHLIFEDLTYNLETILSRLRELSFLNKGLKIFLEDERSGEKLLLQQQGGIVDFVTYLNKIKMHPPQCIYLAKRKMRSR
jgi:DNA gyrase subunit B